MVAEETDRLRTLLEPAKRNSKIARPVFIDSPACNPLSAQDLADIKRFLDVGDIEPIAVVAAGTETVDLIESLKAFAMLGVKRIIVTRLDASRRIGSLLTAVDQTKHAFSLSSDSPYLGSELEHFTPSAIARRLLMVPNLASFQKSAASPSAAYTRTKAS